MGVPVGVPSLGSRSKVLRVPEKSNTEGRGELRRDLFFSVGLLGGKRQEHWSQRRSGSGRYETSTKGRRSTAGPSVSHPVTPSPNRHLYGRVSLLPPTGRGPVQGLGSPVTSGVLGVHPPADWTHPGSGGAVDR